jgi:hypothetical protein
MATKNISLKDSWKQFISIVFQPFVLILILASMAAGYLAANQKDPKIIALMTFIAAICGGALGGILTKRWSEMTEERVIFARGKTAVRALYLLLNNIAHLEKRTKVFLSRRDIKEEEDVGEAVDAKVAFEEIIGLCRVLEEEALSSIENWTDIIPEADVKTKIGMISELQQLVESLQIDIGELKGQVDEAKENKAEVAALRKRIQDKEALLEDARTQLLGRQIPLVGTSGSIFRLEPSPSQLFRPESVKTCAKCGRVYIEVPSLLDTISSQNQPVRADPTGTSVANLCKECKEKVA